MARAAATGIGVTVEVHGARRPLPVQVEHAAYRIVQEALTNVARYARPPVATVRVHYAERDLIVRVDDGGTGVGASVPVGSGTGIAGMRERATALGGIVTAGPRPGGGFGVEARLPVPPAPVVPTDVPATAGDAP